MSPSPLESKTKSGTSISSVADWIPAGLLPVSLLYPFSRRLRQLHSPYSRHIGVTGDPPLCGACACLLSRPFTVGEHGDFMALNSKRLSKSAELGCYICSILYNAECNPYSLWMPDTPVVKRIKDVEAGRKATGFNMWIDHSVDKTMCERFSLVFDINMEKMWLGLEIPAGQLDIWRLSLTLVPKEEVEIMSPRMLSASTSPASTAALSMEWIETCQKCHQSTCRVLESATWLPTRLIEVIHTGLDYQARLYVTSSLSKDIRYVTLSHCWGQLEIYKLLKSNIDDLKVSMPIHRLTLLFRDALDFTGRIGVKYIWIDSLCIIQDSEDDWISESALMGEVYKNSWCNIAATGFADGQAGLYVHRNPAVLFPRKFKFEICDNDENGGQPLSSGSEFYCLEDILYSDITLSPLAYRAWVYQERLLSPRIIHFGSHQILWECNQLEACETFPEGVPFSMQKRFKATRNLNAYTKLPSGSPGGKSSTKDTLQYPKTTSSVEDAWRNIRNGYNDKNLTFYTDKIVAVSGLMREMERVSNDTFIAGLRKSKFLEDLLWYCPYTEMNQIRGRQRPPIYQAPSWSWLSLNEGVSQIYGESLQLAEIIEHSIIHPHRGSSPNTSSSTQITDGYIRVRGRLTRASFAQTERSLRRANKNTFKDQELVLNSISHENLVVPATLLPDIWDMPSSRSAGATSVRPSIGKDFYLLPLVQGERKTRLGLILRRTKIKGEYQRLGLWMQVYGAEDETLGDKFTALGSHVPKLEECDYESLSGHGECIVKII